MNHSKKKKSEVNLINATQPREAGHMHVLDVRVSARGSWPTKGRARQSDRAGVD